MFLDPFELIVGLNQEGKAEGEVYIDDGESFKFEQGEFVYRKFIFDGIVLKSVDIGNGKLLSFEGVIEQIRIAGLKGKPQKIIGVNGEELEFEWEAEVLTILRTQILINADFTITFNF
jgi:alpha 1,3-glucosidase